MARLLWDWQTFSPVAASYSSILVRLSGESLALFLATEELTEIERWQDGAALPDTTTRDTIEALVAKAYTEIMTNVGTGTIFPLATAAIPEGALECDGATYLRTDYPTLYAAMDAAFVVDADHFAVPDLRGRTIIGSGSGTGLTAYSPGDTGGEEAHTLTTAEIPSHSHGVTDPTHSHAEGTTAPTVEDIGPGVPTPGVVGVVGTTGAAATGISIQNTGGGGAHENRQPFVALRYAIWT